MNNVKECEKLLEKFKNSDEPIDKQTVIDTMEITIGAMKLSDKLMTLLNKTFYILKKYKLDKDDAKTILEMSWEIQNHIDVQKD